MSDRISLLEQRFAALNPSQLNIEDNSAEHAGHVGARDGGGHFTVHIVSEAFSGKSLVQRHRMVYDTVTDLMNTEIHALSIQARSPEEMS